jgi:hypothetical protein
MPKAIFAAARYDPVCCETARSILRAGESIWISIRHSEIQAIPLMRHGAISSKFPERALRNKDKHLDFDAVARPAGVVRTIIPCLCEYGCLRHDGHSYSTRSAEAADPKLKPLLTRISHTATLSRGSRKIGAQLRRSGRGRRLRRLRECVGFFLVSGGREGDAAILSASRRRLRRGGLRPGAIRRRRARRKRART